MVTFAFNIFVHDIVSAIVQCLQSEEFKFNQATIVQEIVQFLTIKLLIYNT